MDLLSARKLVSLILLIVMAPTLVAFSVWFYVRRKVQPLRARQPALVLVTNALFTGCLISLLQKLAFFDSFECYMDIWQDYVLVLILGNVYVSRAWILFVTFEVTSERIEAADAEEADEISLTRTSESRDHKPQQIIEPDDNDLPHRSSAAEHDNLAAHKDRSSSTVPSLSHMPPSSSNPDIQIPLAKPRSPRDSMLSKRSLSGSRGDGSFKFLNNRWLMSWNFLAPTIIVVTLVVLIPPLYMSIHDDLPALAQDARCEPDTSIYRRIHLGITVIYVMAIVWFAYKLRHSFDIFFIGLELRYTGLTFMVLIVVWAPFRMVAALDEWQADNIHVSIILVAVALYVGFLWSTVWPIYLSYTNPLLRHPEPSDDSAPYESGSDLSRRGSRENSVSGSSRLSTSGITARASSRVLSLRDVLAPGDEEGFIAFRAFLRHEFSVENLLFWRRVNNFRTAGEDLLARRRGADPEPEEEVADKNHLSVKEASTNSASRLAAEDEQQLLNMAVALYQQYIAPSSPFEVNLPGDLRAVLEAHFGYFAVSDDAQASGPATAFRVDENSVELPELVGATPEERRIYHLVHAFDAAQQNIYELMENDSFPRFRVSRQCKQLQRKRYLRKKRNTRTNILTEMKLAT